VTLSEEQLAADELLAREIAFETHELVSDPLTGPRVLAKAAGILTALIDVTLNIPQSKATVVTTADTLIQSYSAARKHFENRFERPAPMYVNPFHPDFRPHLNDGGALYACHWFMRAWGLWSEADWTCDPTDVEARIAVNKKPVR
jgi:hypothetical protein